MNFRVTVFRVTMLCASKPHTSLKNNEFQGTMDETKLRNRRNILILALVRHDESLMLFHDF
jgi:hypothetical protein